VLQRDAAKCAVSSVVGASHPVSALERFPISLGHSRLRRRGWRTRLA
jgi:hypothetical protein